VEEVQPHQLRHHQHKYHQHLQPLPTVAHRSILLALKTLVTVKEVNLSPVNVSPTQIAAVAAALCPLESAQGLVPPSRTASKVVASVEERHHQLKHQQQKHHHHRHKLPQPRYHQHRHPQLTAAHLSIPQVPRTSVTAKEDNSSPANVSPMLTAAADAVPCPPASAQDLVLPSKTASRDAVSVEEQLPQLKLPQLKHHRQKLPQPRHLPQQHPRVAPLSMPPVSRTLVTAKVHSSSVVSASVLLIAGVDAVLDLLEFALALVRRRKLARLDVDSLRSDLSGGQQVLLQNYSVERRWFSAGI